MQNIGKEMMADAKFYMGYSRWVEKENRYETWDESVDRVIDMHRQKYSDKLTFELNELLHYAADAYKDKLVLGSQRALQFGGAQLLDKEARNYNCSFSHADRPEFFQECMYLLLCGCGVGFSVQKQHVNNLPNISRPDHSECEVFEIPDTIEGWSDAFGVLLSTYFVTDSPFPEWQGKRVHFDFSKIRPKGSLISGGFKAPGPNGLRESLIACEKLLDQEVDSGETRIRPIVAYDFVMHMANAVLSGGK